MFTHIFIDKFIYSFIILYSLVFRVRVRVRVRVRARVRTCTGFVPAASQDWGLGFGPVTVDQERAKRAPDLWMPPPNLKPQSWRAGNEVRKVIEAIACTMLF